SAKAIWNTQVKPASMTAEIPPVMANLVDWPRNEFDLARRSAPSEVIAGILSKKTYFDLKTKTRWIIKFVTVATPCAITKAMVSLSKPSKPKACSGEFSSQYSTFCTANVEAYNKATLMAVLPEIFAPKVQRSEEHTSELQSRFDLVCRLLLEKKKNTEGDTKQR